MGVCFLSLPWSSRTRLTSRTCICDDRGVLRGEHVSDLRSGAIEEAGNTRRPTRETPVVQQCACTADLDVLMVVLVINLEHYEGHTKSSVIVRAWVPRGFIAAAETAQTSKVCTCFGLHGEQNLTTGHRGAPTTKVSASVGVRQDDLADWLKKWWATSFRSFRRSKVREGAAGKVRQCGRGVRRELVLPDACCVSSS